MGGKAVRMCFRNIDNVISITSFFLHFFFYFRLFLRQIFQKYILFFRRILIWHSFHFATMFVGQKKVNNYIWNISQVVENKKIRFLMKVSLRHNKHIFGWDSVAHKAMCELIERIPITHIIYQFGTIQRNLCDIILKENQCHV